MLFSVRSASLRQTKLKKGVTMLQKLIRFLPLAEKVIAKKTTLPILSHVCVRDGFISATDLEHWVQMEIDDTRNYTIPLNVLKTILKAKPKTLEIGMQENEKVKISYDNRHLTFKSMDTDEFPAVPVGTFKSLGLWSLGLIRKLQSQVAYASKEELKPAMTGIYVHQNGKMESCATDGHVMRLMEDASLGLDLKLKGSFMGVLPKKALLVLSKSVKGTVPVSATDKHMKFNLNGIDFFVRLIDEKYPDFRSVIPEAFMGRVSLKTSELVNLVQDAKPFVFGDSKQGNIDIGSSGLELQVNNPEKDIQWDASVSALKQSGDEITMGLNVHYLEKILKGISEKEFCWEYSSPVSASILKGQDSITHLIMPVRIKENDHGE